VSVGWSGSDPSDFSDGGSANYELGNEFIANADVTINNVRVWGPAVSASRANRAGKIWSSGGSLLASATLPDTLLAGWHTYPLDSAVEVPSGTTVVVSFDTTNTYGAVTSSLGFPRLSADTNVSAVRGRRDLATPDVFPSGTTTGAFYGVDIDYQAGLVGNNRPTVGISAVVDTLQAVATLTIDDEDPNTVTFVIDWGDGQQSGILSSLGPHSHTYTTAGLKAIMVTATDEGGLQDSAAVAVDVPDSFTAPECGVDVDGLLNVLASIARRNGYLDAVLIGEPKRKPAEGITMGIWLDVLGPALSGAGATSLRALWFARIYTNMLAEPADLIDPKMTCAAAAFMGGVTNDFRLARHPQVRSIDLLGSHGVALEGRAGYIEQDGKLYRTITVTVPILLNDVWDQED
jgi:hypothetical protein